MLFCARFGHLIALLRKHRHIPLSRFPRVIGILLISLLLQRYIQREDNLYQTTIQDIRIPEDPLFIIGHWRSGTTYLHYLMSLDIENFAYPTTYQCFFPTVFLTLNEQTWFFRLVRKFFRHRSRSIDNMEISLATPQEEEWMYLPEGGYNYIGEQLIFPKTALSNAEEMLRLSTSRDSREITLRIFKKLTYKYRKRILSKSPGHFSRLPMLHEVFPDSQYVFIVRNPYDVIISSLHAKRILTRALTLQEEQHESVETVARFLSSYFEILNKGISLLDPKQYVVIRYEDLTVTPRQVIQDIYKKLSILYTKRFDGDLETYLFSLQNYRKNQFEITTQTKDIVYRECRRVFEAYGYER